MLNTLHKGKDSFVYTRRYMLGIYGLFGGELPTRKQGGGLNSL